MLQNIRAQYQSLHCILQREGLLGSLYLGDIQAALDLQLIQSKAINTVITAAEGLEHVKYPPSINHIRYSILDHKSQLISKYFIQVFRVIESARQKGNILIHCAAGVSRSATLVIAYIMYKKEWPFKRSIEYVRQKRSVICPNLGFQMQLKTFEKVACKRKSQSQLGFEKKRSFPKREQLSNLPQIYLKPKNNKYLKFKKHSLQIKKPERQLYLESLLHFEDNFRIHQLKTPIHPKSVQSHKPLEKMKPRSSQLLSKISF